MMKATIFQQKNMAVIKVEGRLSGPWVEELARSWERLAETGAERLVIELAGVSFIDEEGKKLLKRIAQAGTKLEAAGCLTRAIVEEVAGESPAGRRRLNGGTGAACVLLLCVLCFSSAGLQAAQQGAMSGSVAAAAQAQPAAPLTISLTLKDAVALAMRQNPQVQIAAIDLATSQQNRSLERAKLLPQATLALNDRAVRANIEANFGKPFAGFPEHIGPFQVFDAGTLFTVPVFDLTLWRHWQAARHQVEATEADRQGVREQVTLLVVSQYLDGLQATANVQAATARVQLAQALYDQAADLQKHGVSTGLDTLRANVELQNEQQRLIEDQTAEKTALYGLARLLNLDPRAQLVLTDRLSFYETPPFEAAESISEAMTHRPEMAAIDAQQRQLAAERHAAREEKLPTLFFQGQYLQEGISAARVIPTYAYEAQVRVPLFTGGRIHAQQAEADLALSRLTQQKQDLANEIALQVKTAVADLDAARHEVQVSNVGVELAREEVQQARDRFQAGVANNIEVVTAQDALARANDNQIGALYRYNQARADLARATGQMQNLYQK